METRAAYLLVGLFIISSIIGVLSFFLWLTQKDADYNVNYYTTYFSGSVTGLSLGGTVSFLGVPVGTVKKITLHPEKLNVVDVTISITKDIPIKEDAYASLELQGLTGYKFVQIYGGSPDSPPLKVKPEQKYPVIPSRYSGVDEIMTILPRMMSKLTNLVDRINATFDEKNRDRFADTLKNIDVLSKRLADSSKPLEAFIYNANDTLKNFGVESKKTLEKIDGVADNISAYFARNKIALDTLTQSGSYELLQTLGSIEEMSKKATHLLKKLDDTPRALLFETERKGICVPE